ncbi:hypothetical protein X797_003199 [Metarhizium robertsii]|uniref:Uncharacterized protein n=2 Tax=Metarhizium robertsii TaxID=568076 RepID=E9ETX0_METRA|nr:uncharacterized protein MAA_03469 [Metarhizium robertsii ARSEF 23]EFZ00873.1 hypothetical protein MAA_03469 [Metarhizium robertsii ARSEF 23]EXV03399.1 hypothetical protein X797_003199 [Metarhizium robertsii]
MTSPPGLLETIITETDSDPCQDTHRTDNLPPRNNRQPILPPLPQQSSPLARSSSPRHHASTASSHSSARRPLRAGNVPALSNSPSTPRRQRQQSPSSYRPPSFRRITTNVVAPTHWGEDTTTSSDNDEHSNDSDDLFLSIFADNDFSSPSTYPSFTSNPAASEAPQPDQAAFQPQPAAPTTNPCSEAAPLRQVSACTRTLATPSRSTTQLSSFSLGESQSTSFTTDNGEDSATSQSSYPSFSDKMPPPPPRFQHILNDTDPPPIDKRMRTSQQSSGAVNSASVGSLAMPSAPLDDDDDDDLFGENLTTQGSEIVDGEELTTIDLTEANKVPEELKKPQQDNRIKISKFQCVICMDDVTTLTVTHCGKSSP